MVAYRAGMNHCDEFVFADREEVPESTEKQEQARGALAALFGGERDDARAEDVAKEFLGEQKPKTDPKKAFDNLFGS